MTDIVERLRRRAAQSASGPLMTADEVLLHEAADEIERLRAEHMAMDLAAAYDLADSLDLPEGAMLALGAELAGMEYDDFCEAIAPAGKGSDQ